MVPQLGEPAAREFIGPRGQYVADLAIGGTHRQNRLPVGAIAEGCDNADRLGEPRAIGGGQAYLRERRFEPQPRRSNRAQQLVGDRLGAPTLARTPRDEACDFERRQRDAHRGTAKTKALGNLLLGDELAGLDFATDQRSAEPANGLRSLRAGARESRLWIKETSVKHVS